MTIHDFSVKDGKGQALSLGQYTGKVLLIVNTATGCGLTPQYAGLEALYKKFHDRGFEVLDFPCNQFLEQAPGTVEEINAFCTLNYGTTFPRFGKINVNGDQADPLYRWLKEQKPTDKGNAQTDAFAQKVKAYTPDAVEGDIKWNFGKFLIDAKGNVVERYSPAYDPQALETDIEALLG